MPAGAGGAYGALSERSGDLMPMGIPHQGRRYEPDPPAAAADDHLENHLLNEENRRLKEELRRAEHALKVAGKVLRPYLK